VRGKSLASSPVTLLLTTCRCTAPPTDLDGEGYVPRSRDHTEALVEEFELGVLWNEYGLIGDIVVGLLFSASLYAVANPACSRSPTTSLALTFTN
jgi:hypothetical protein